MNVVIATPAQSFSSLYVSSLVETLHSLHEIGINALFHTRAGSNITELRTCMMSDIYESPRDKPDKVFWIDSDISWVPSDFIKILSSPFRITCGAYMQNPNGELSVCSKISGTDRLSPYKVSDLSNLKEYEKIHASGFGFICLDFDVIEEIGEHWFAPIWLTPELDEAAEHICTSEDTSFCMRANRKQIPIMWDTTVILGHEKSTLWLTSDASESSAIVGIPPKRVSHQWVKNLQQDDYSIIDRRN